MTNVVLPLAYLSTGTGSRRVALKFPTVALSPVPGSRDVAAGASLGTLLLGGGLLEERSQYMMLFHFWNYQPLWSNLVSRWSCGAALAAVVHKIGITRVSSFCTRMQCRVGSSVRHAVILAPLGYPSVADVVGFCVQHASRYFEARDSP